MGCSGKSVDENDPAVLMKEAEEDIESDRYQLAIEKLRMVKNKFPYSNQARLAQLKIADVYFLQESYTEAALAYEAFRDLYPKHEKVPYAMFRVGKSYLNDTPGNVARDLGPAQRALDSYNEFLRRFPNAPESDEARKDVEQLRRTLAEKELYIASFYVRENAYEAAQGRLKKILSLYPETESAKIAEERLKEISSKIPAKKREDSPAANGTTNP